MATIIDALVISLGLDASGFAKGQKEATSAFKKTKEEADTFGKGIEASGKKAADSIENVARQALALFGILAGARSVSDFAGKITTADAALGRLAANLGVAPSAFAAMTMAVERNGGSAEAAASSFRALSDSFEEIKRTGSSGILTDLYRLQGAGGANIDTRHGFDKALPGIIKNLENIKRLQGQVAADAYARSIGLDGGTANFLEQGQSKVSSDLAESRRIGTPNAAATKAAQDLQRAWIALQQTATSLGRKVLDDLAPAIVKLLDAITEFIQKNPQLVEALGGLLAVLAGAKMISAVSWLFKLRTAILGVTATQGALAAFGTASVASLGPLLALVTSLALALGYVATQPYGNPALGKEENEGGVWGTVKRALGIDPPLGSTPQGGTGGIGLGLRGHAGGGGAAGTGRHGGHGAGTVHDTTNYTGSNANVLKQAAAALGTSPHDLAMVIAYETQGTFSPHIHGGYSKRYGAGAFQGLIQFGPPERAQFGANDKQSFAEQMPAVVSFLKSRGFKPGMGLADLYSTINAGRPGQYNARDVNGSVMDHVARMQKDRERDVVRFLGSGDKPAGSAVPGAHTPPSAYGDLSNHPMNQFHSATPAMPGTVTAGALHAAMRKLSPESFRRISGLSHVAPSHLHHTVGGNTSSNHVNVGAVHVTVPNGDGDKIAKSIGPALRRHSMAIHANYGPN